MSDKDVEVRILSSVLKKTGSRRVLDPLSENLFFVSLPVSDFRGQLKMSREEMSRQKLIDTS